MATLMDHKRRTKTHGKTESLEAFMVNDLMSVTVHRPKNLRGYCESSVRAAVRRGGRTDAGQELVLSADERRDWEAANPLPE